MEYQCPHFKKIRFQKIRQVTNEQVTVEDQIGKQNQIILLQEEEVCNDQNEDYDEIDEVTDQGVDKVNIIHSNMRYNAYQFHSKNQLEQEECQLNMTCSSIQSNKNLSEIKTPKQLNIRKMFKSIEAIKNIQNNHAHRVALQQNLEQNYEIPSQTEQYIEAKMIPHILISKSSIMTNNFDNFFNGQIFLSQQLENSYVCQVKDFIIRIQKDEKIKYFIQLLKVSCKLQKIQNSQRGIRLNMNCKVKQDSIKIYFLNAIQRQIFSQVFKTNLENIKRMKKKKTQQYEMQQDKENFNNFQMDQSRILNEDENADDNKFNYNQRSQSLSSLSLSSYEGDSLVFQTQRQNFDKVKSTGNTFDILLFKNKSIMSKMQRIFTNSDYDHIAMLLRTAKNQLLMLQSTSNAGVAIYTYDSLMKINRDKYFVRIGLRKYKGQKTLGKVSRLEQFIRKTVGKKYKFDPMYLIKSQANVQKETYFCSQLVAEALQYVGILSNMKPSFKYLPKHFGNESLNNQLIDGKFSQTIILD